jgi:hypothetical protein
MYEASAQAAISRERLSLTSKELSTAAVFHAQVEIILGLERMVERHDERMVARRKDLLLGKRPFDLIPLDHLLFAQHYHMIRVSLHY